MASKVDLQGSVTLTAANKIAEICQPLSDAFNIQYFRYMRLFNDGTRFILCNQPDVMRYFYEEGHYPLAWHDQAKPAYVHKPGFTVWAIKRLSDSKEQKKIEEEMKRFFNIKQGIAYVERHSDSAEIYDFGSSGFHIYDVKCSVLQRFIFYFKEQTQKLLKNAQSEKIYVPVVDKEIAKNYIDDKEKLFLESIKTKRYYLGGALEGTYITQSEIVCLNWCFKGKTAEETALLLGISKRTVERHLESVKRKLNCYKLSQLIPLGIKLGILSDLT